MKFIHTGDLHIGKIVNGFSMLEEQKRALDAIFTLAEETCADAVLIAGDIYDRAIPPKEGVSLFDGFLGRCTEAGIPVLGIAGNHDSPERISFGEIPLKRQGIYLDGVLKESPTAVCFSDEWGTVTVHLLPFAGPAGMKAAFGDGESDAEGFPEGVQNAVKRMQVSHGERHVLVTHHFVGEGEWRPEVCDSESRTAVGGADLVDASLFDAFDYTALGHLHRAQKVGKRHIYYSGSPVKYSFSEADQRKSVFLVELREKGNLTIERRFLTPIHDMRIIRGPLMELMKPEVYDLADREDYICAVLTDEEELLDPAESLRAVYPNLMQLVLEKNLTGEGEGTFSGRTRERKSPEELFEEFFREVTGREADEARLDVMREAIEWAEKEAP
ncbi:exonuclease SbcCD subunit D [Lacrimispora sp. NSJ-141]|uniref:Nuclease SbcCD subunit D n=1 Tax=Lientehia hominis TaxID=2897778 RepID=A0AAP2RJ80_9FIRM|nr:exonuclease SbcCD subunit D [Lientehia hominis]MCD2492378.1 exonuclease SbcCD subunit D [Lientehia hominis]